MGIFNELEKVLAKTGDVVGAVAHDLSSKTTGWGEKADVWLDETLDKVKESVKKEETVSTDAPADAPAATVPTDVEDEAPASTPKPGPVSERRPSGSK